MWSAISLALTTAAHPGNELVQAHSLVLIDSVMNEKLESHSTTAHEQHSHGDCQWDQQTVVAQARGEVMLILRSMCVCVCVCV